MYDVVIIGCGIVGAAAAYELSRYQLSTAVLERENDVAAGTTKANSAILHAGYDPEPGTLMARLNVEGVRLAKEWCQRLDVPYRQCGSLVLAFSQEEIAALKKLLQQGRKNGVPDLQLLDAASAKELDPGISSAVAAALYAPSAAIVSPWEYAFALIETAVKNGVQLFLNHEVTAIRRIPGGYRITAPSESIETKTVLNAAGVHADTIHNMAAVPSFQILPNRGQYYLLDHSEGDRVSHVIFQCPTEAGKGVLAAPTVHGNLIVGPNRETVEDPEDLSNTSDGLAYISQAALKSVPEIRFRESIRNFSGIRAVPDRDDFIIEEAEGAPGFIDLAGIQSPGLSAAPAIAKLAVSLLGDTGLKLEEKQGYSDGRQKVRLKNLSLEQKNQLIRQNPSYGRIVCRCESVTEGEILDALHSPIPPCSVDGVKRRCNAGMGRCQGGFCGPRIVELLARELKKPACEIVQDRAGSQILYCETKKPTDNV